MLQKAKYIVPNMNTLRSVEIEEVSWFAHRLKSIILTSPFVSCTGTGARHKLACILFDHNTHSPINLAQYLPHYHWTSDKRLIHTEMKSIAHQALNLWRCSVFLHGLWMNGMTRFCQSLDLPQSSIMNLATCPKYGPWQYFVNLHKHFHGSLRKS